MFGWNKARSGVPTQTQFDATTSAGLEAGLLSGTKVASAMGWRPVEAITEGDQVLTFDAGLKTVTKVTRIRLWSDEAMTPSQQWPLEVPTGALGNREPIYVLPGQNIMVESDAAEDMYGDPFTLIPAEAIAGLYGVSRVPPRSDQEVIMLHFASDQVVFSETGALFFCPAAEDLVSRTEDEAGTPFYSILPMDEARFLAVQIEDEITAACTHSPQDVWAAAVPT